MSEHEKIVNPDDFNAVDAILIELGIDMSEGAGSEVIASFIKKFFNRVDDDRHGSFITGEN